MEWIERLNTSLRYIEEHLIDEIELEQLGKIACCSSYHYQRMFTYMAGITLSEYIRRRRMSLAAVDLKQSDMKIIDVAMKYGYSSPTAFNRAFQTIHGIAPSHIKEDGVMIKSYPPIKFSVMIKGVEEMNYRIEKKEAFRILGVSMPLSNEVEENFKEVPKMWQEMGQSGKIMQLASLMDSQPMGVLGVSACNDIQQWRYFIAVASTKNDERYEEYTIPAATWAIFSGEGDGAAIQELEKRIVTEWLPTSGYEYANAPDIEVYLSQDPEHMQFEVWIPVLKK